MNLDRTAENIIRDYRTRLPGEDIFELFGLNPFTDFDVSVKTAPKKKTIKDHIDRIVYNGPATIIFWDDGTKTIAKCDPKDKKNKSVGVLVCVMKYLCRKAGVKYSDVTKLHP